MNNSDFIDGLRNQDPAAAKHLNECFVPSVWRFVYIRVQRDRHLAEDIVSDVVLALVNAVKGDVEIEHPLAWLRTVARRRIHDHFRAADRVRHLIEQVEQQVDLVDENDASTLHDVQLRQQNVREAMGKLPENYQMALEWKYIDQLSVKVIAERLEATEKSAESILFRARNALKKKLQDEQPTQRQNEHPPPAGLETKKDSTEEKRSDQTSSTLDRNSFIFATRLAKET